MFVFFYILAAMGVAYWAKLDGRSPAVWLGAAIILTIWVWSPASGRHRPRRRRQVV